MAGDLDPVEPEPGSERSTTDSPIDAPGHRLARPDQAGLIDLIVTAQGDPPVGLIIVGWERPEPGLRSPATPNHRPAPGSDPTYDRQVEQAVVYAVTAASGSAAEILASAEAEVAVVRSAMGGPATAEALAHRIAKQLDVELDRLATTAARPTARWAIGVAVGHRDDRAANLLRYAESALNDAWLLGGRRLVAFDDGNRELLNRPSD